jgi:hypothetical protein
VASQLAVLTVALSWTAVNAILTLRFVDLIVERGCSGEFDVVRSSIRAWHPSVTRGGAEPVTQVERVLSPWQPGMSMQACVDCIEMCVAAVVRRT